MNDYVEPLILTNGYDKRKTRETKAFRRFTVDDIKRAIATNQTEFYIIDNRGEYRTVRRNGAFKTWKRDPDRFEAGFKYGMYEHFRLTTDEMCQLLVVPL